MVSDDSSILEIASPEIILIILSIIGTISVVVFMSFLFKTENGRKINTIIIWEAASQIIIGITCLLISAYWCFNEWPSLEIAQLTKYKCFGIALLASIMLWSIANGLNGLLVLFKYKRFISITGCYQNPYVNYLISSPVAARSIGPYFIMAIVSAIGCFFWDMLGSTIIEDSLYLFLSFCFLIIVGNNATKCYLEMWAKNNIVYCSETNQEDSST